MGDVESNDEQAVTEKEAKQFENSEWWYNRQPSYAQLLRDQHYMGRWPADRLRTLLRPSGGRFPDGRRERRTLYAGLCSRRAKPGGTGCAGRIGRKRPVDLRPAGVGP